MSEIKPGPTSKVDMAWYLPRSGFDGMLGDEPKFAPWLGYGEFGIKLRESATGHPAGRLYFIDKFLEQGLKIFPDGEVWETGVFRGDSASFLARSLVGRSNLLRLFDTFQGMPETDPDRDWHKAGDFSNTSLDFVRNRIKAIRPDNVSFHPGIVPQSFNGVPKRPIAFAHVDLDIYDGIKTSCERIWPHLALGGAIVFDDYAWASCPGAMMAVDEFFENTKSSVVTLPTGQAFVVKAD